MNPRSTTSAYHLVDFSSSTFVGFARNPLKLRGRHTGQAYVLLYTYPLWSIPVSLQLAYCLGHRSIYPVFFLV